MSRSRLHLVIALLLPLLALKSLLPPGYMPSADDGQLRIVMCSAGLAALGAEHGDSETPPAEHPACAFAVAGLAAPPPAPFIYWLPPAGAGLPVVEAVAIATSPAELHGSTSPRGPPAVLRNA